MTSSLFTCVGLPSSSKKLVYTYPPNEVLAADYHSEFYHFFSSTTYEPTHVVLAVAEPLFLQQIAKKAARRALRAIVDAMFVAEIEHTGDGSVRTV